MKRSLQRDGLHGLHISELDIVNVGLTMAHCYSDLSRLPAKVEQGGCEGGLEPPATGIQRVRGSPELGGWLRREQDGVIFLMEGVSGDLQRVALFL